ncbi:MAG: LapA family protein, partial [Brachybacterium sp.]
MWIGLILGAIILVLLLIFVIQNNVTAGFQYFGAEFDLPLGVAMLLAAIAGALVMALVGSVRMIQMSWTIRKLRKQQDKIHRATR